MTDRYLIVLLSLTIAVFGSAAGAQTVPNTELRNGRWFDGTAFKPRTMYSVDGRFTSKKPAKIDESVDLAGLWVIPPFAEGHNHRPATGVEEWDRRAINNFLTAGVFYVKTMGNLPIDEDGKKALGLNRPDGLDVVFGQGSITGSGGHPIGLIEDVLMRQGYFPGFTKERLRDYRYFTVDSAEELERKWPAVLRNGPDHIKIMLWYSEEYEKRKNDPGFFSLRGLDPKLVPLIVQKARAAGLRVAGHVTSTADLKVAVDAGVYELAHLPLLGRELISESVAKVIAERGIVVNTTANRADAIIRLPRVGVPANEQDAVAKIYLDNLRLLYKSGAKLVVASDDTSDTSVKEALYLNGLGIFDTAKLIKMWTETTPLSIYPGRKIGRFEDGYEASFIALEADPIADLANVKKIRYRFKQGLFLEPAGSGK